MAAKRKDPSPTKRKVFAMVSDIPSGSVTTYGIIAKALGITPRNVATILAHLEEEEVFTWAWHRVVGANGMIRIRTVEGAEEQRRRLEDEGHSFDDRGMIENFGRLTHLF